MSGQIESREDLEESLDTLQAEIDRVDELEELLKSNLNGAFARISDFDDRLSTTEKRLDELEEQVKVASATTSDNKRGKLEKAIDAKGQLDDLQSFDSIEEMQNAVRELSLAHPDGQIYMAPPERPLDAIEAAYSDLPDEAQDEFLNDHRLYVKIRAARNRFNDWMGKKRREQEMPSQVEAGPANYPGRQGPVDRPVRPGRKGGARRGARQDHVGGPGREATRSRDGRQLGRGAQRAKGPGPSRDRQRAARTRGHSLPPGHHLRPGSLGREAAEREVRPSQAAPRPRRPGEAHVGRRNPPGVRPDDGRL